MTQPSNLRHVGDRIEQLLGELRSSVPRDQWDRIEEVLALVTELYGGGLSKITGLLAGHADGAALLRRLTEDELVASLLVLHGLHPQDLSERVHGALASVRPYLASHGGDVELLDLDETAGAVRLRLLGSCDGCPTSSATLRFAVEQAIVEAAPEVVRIEVEGLTDEGAEASGPDLGAQGPSGPSERGAQGPSGPSERGAQGPSGPSERGAQGPSGPSERGAQGPSGPSERGAQGPSGPSERGPDLAVTTPVRLGRASDGAMAATAP